MLKEVDLKLAVEHGIISTEQLEKLKIFAGEVSGYTGSEERFRLLRGFNDIFLSVGIAILSVGLWLATFSFGKFGIVGLLVCPAILWLLAEYFVLKKGWTLSGITLAISFSLFTGLLGALVIKAGADFNGMLIPDLSASLPKRMSNSVFLAGMCGGAFLGALAYNMRFKVPFTMMIMGLAAFWLTVTLLGILFGSVSLPGGPFVTLVLGLLIFAVAMIFDISDPKRLTRSSDNAFWLHLLAAPLIVHTVISTIAWTGNGFDEIRAMLVLLAISGLALVALLIDRRALLVSALTYFGIAISTLVRSVGIDKSFVIMLTLLLLGGAILMLGIGWQGLRQRLVGLLPDDFVTTFLPPVMIRQT